MTAVIVLGAVLAWAVASRYLFRRWVRDDTIWTSAKHTCTHGYRRLHEGRSCHNMGEPASHDLVAVIALAAGLVLPATLLVMFVMARPPQGKREREEKTRALEEENRRLQREQEKGELKTTADAGAMMDALAGRLCPCEGTMRNHIRSPHYVLGCEPR